MVVDILYSMAKNEYYDDTEVLVADIVAKRRDLLDGARARKNDEYYTPYSMVEAYFNQYVEYDPDFFRNKSIILPCDYFRVSAFFKYFMTNFKEYGIKRLTTTCYSEKSGFGAEENYAVLDRDTIADLDNITLDDVQVKRLEGDGDILSGEVQKLIAESDFMFTNPPFSILSKILKTLHTNKVKFALVTPLTVVDKSYCDKWLVSGEWSIDPNDCDLVYFHTSHTRKHTLPSSNSTQWITNIDHGNSKKYVHLLRAADAVEFFGDKSNAYKRYDNFDAIEIPKYNGIPRDYSGVMGVPVSVLKRYTNDQIDIVGMANNRVCPENLRRHEAGKYDRPVVNGERLFSRVFIKLKNPEEPTVDYEQLQELIRNRKSTPK